MACHLSVRQDQPFNGQDFGLFHGPGIGRLRLKASFVSAAIHPDPQAVAACRGPGPALQCLMPALTRRRYPEVREECWHVFYGDVHAGTIAIRVGIPPGEDPWGWTCGFYPGSHPGEYRTGTGASFDEARGGFEEAWKVFLSKRTEADFQEWRDRRDWTARKYEMWERGEKLPSQISTTMMGCPCGARFDSHDPAGSYVHRGHIYAAAQGLAVTGRALSDPRATC
jgi:hypothetical protein